MSGIDENGNEIHYDVYFASCSHLNPDLLKDAMNNVNNKEYFDKFNSYQKQSIFNVTNVGIGLIMLGCILLVSIVVFDVI